MPTNNSIALLPLDNRPVSYLLPKQIANFSSIDLVLPERKYLGDLKKESNSLRLEKWIKSLVGIDSLIISLDNFVYGGLVQSRRHNFTLEELKSRVNLFKNNCRVLSQQFPTVYGFSSIMRIPNYNSNEEEKDYWKDYGERIFKWSELTHKIGGKNVGSTRELTLQIDDWYKSSNLIPPEILADYKGHRDKNLTINLLWLESLHEHCFKYLIFSCDDSSKYGMNVVEAEYIKKEIGKHNFRNLAKVIAGTDEIPLVLFTKANLKTSKTKPKISLYFNSIQGKEQIAKYESNSIYTSILNQLEILEIEIKDFNESDIALCVHLADSIQGDHVFKEKPNDTKKNVSELIKLLEETDKSFILLDLAYANGADPNLIDALLNAKINWRNCYGYSGWNTCSNSTGSALSIGINRWISKDKNIFNEEAFKKCLLVRFLDDYAYQTEIRHSKITEDEINKKIKPYIEKFSRLLELNDINVKCTLPWGRSFEVEIVL